MSYKWPDKDKDETLDYNIDWSRFLGEDTITSSNWYITDADGVKQLATSSNTPINGLNVLFGVGATSVSSNGKVTTARLSAGTNNVRYKISNQIGTASGLTYERSVFLRVRDK